MPLELIVDSVAALAERLVRRLEVTARQAISARDRFTLAVAGGSVATTMFPRLAGTPIDWSRTEVFFVDERAVPAGDRESNFRVAHTMLVEHGPLDPAHLHRMPADLPDLEAAAAQCAVELEQSLGAPPRLDVALLGMGGDGHVASLFARHATLELKDRWVAAVHDSPKPPTRRLTLTLPVLTGAGLVIVAAFGPEKATAVHDAVTNPESRLPVALVLREAREALLLLDPDAGLLLAEHGRRKQS